MKSINLACCFALAFTAVSVNLRAGPLDPDCTAEKAVKSTAMKATVGVGGRCTPKEAAADTARDKVGIEEKGPIEKMTKEEDKARKAAKKVVSE